MRSIANGPRLVNEVVEYKLRQHPYWQRVLDIIFLHGLKVDCVIGIWEWERRITQTVIFDLDMGFDVKRAAETDDVADTLSYRDVAKRITTHVKLTKAKLIERLAEEAAAIILDEFGADWCRVRVNKRGAVSTAGDVGVVIERRSKN